MIYYHNLRQMIVDWLRQEGVENGTQQLFSMLSAIIAQKEHLQEKNKDEEKDAPF